MADFAEPARRPARSDAKAGPARAAQGASTALGGAATVGRLDDIGRRLNMRPALVAQRAIAVHVARPAAPAAQAVPNRTGLPDRLKQGVEALSGQSLDDVSVHRNSPRPAQLQAHAFAQGSEIHLAPGQESHLPHEAWHVAQQKQGRVRATTQLRRVDINDDPALETEADMMGARALSSGGATPDTQPSPMSEAATQRVAIVQRGAAFSGTAKAPPVEYIIARNRQAYNGQQAVRDDRTTLVAECIAAIAGLDDMSTLSDVRELIDALLPVYSDGMLSRIRAIDAGPGTTKKRASRRQRLYALKQQLLGYRLRIEIAFQRLIATLPATTTRAALIAQAQAIQGAGTFLIDHRQNFQNTINGAPPAKRGNREPREYTPLDTNAEVRDTRIDIRAAALANVVRAAGFLPHIVVGLPTGGVQIAARIAGILHARNDAMPALMALRPRFVKDTGAGAFPAAAQDQINARDLESFAAATGTGLGGGPATLNILVVDDFSSSGTSLAQAANQVRTRFEALGRTVDVRTAVSRYTTAQLRPQISSEEGARANSIDYVAGQHGSGLRTAIHDRFHDGDGALRHTMPEVLSLDQGWTDEGDDAIDQAEAL
ncbi:MAG: hypothetical protein JWM65_3867 [Sphingomonas bacterium]|nr:hypothetical protein [Sphingomonas bacterium]